MAWNNWNNKYNKNYNNKKSSKKTKYTQAEKIAFRMGQEERVLATLDMEKDSRVRDAYCKGYSGVSKQTKKSLFGD